MLFTSKTGFKKRQDLKALLSLFRQHAQNPLS